MDFHSLKRRELQALCRKHQIPANLTNLEMAERLSAVDEKRPLTQGRRSCLKSADEIASANESDLEARPGKKVKFSPNNETIEFEKSVVRYSQVNVGRRRKSAMSGDKGAEKVNEDVSEPGVSGRGKFGKGGKRGKTVDTSKSSEVVADRATRRAKRRLLMAGIGVEGGGREATKLEVVEDKGTTSDVMDGGDKEAGMGKSSEENAPGIRGKKTAKADSSEDSATIQNVENEDTRPKRGRPKKKGRTLGGMLVASETGKMIRSSDVMDGSDKEAGTGKSSEENASGTRGKKTAKADSLEPLEDNATIENVENEVTRPKRGRPRKRGTSEGMLAASETGKRTARVEASKDKELVDGGLNENAKQVRRSRRGQSLEEVQIEDQAGERAVIAEAVKGNGLVDDGVTGEFKRVTRSRRGKSPEGVQIEGKAGNRATKVEVVDDGVTGEVRRVTRSRRGKSSEGVQIEIKAGNRATKVDGLEDIDIVDDGAIGEFKGVRRSRRGKSPEGMKVNSKPAKIVTTNKALKSQGVVIDGWNEEPKEVRKSVKGKSSKGAGEELAKDAVIDKGLIDTGLDAKDVRQSRRGKSAAARQVESKEENKVAKDVGLQDKGPVDDGLHGDATDVRRSRRGKSAEGVQDEGVTVKKLTKGEALKDKCPVDDGLVGDAKEVRRPRRAKSPERLHIESKAGKKVTKDEGLKDHDIVVDGLNGDAKEVRRSRRGKSPNVKKVTMDDFIKDIDLVGGLSGDAREARRISRRRNFTAGSGVSEAKSSAVGDVPSENIQNEEHIEVKKPLLSKREASTEESEQNGGVRKRSKKSSNVRIQRSGKEEDCEAASESKEVIMEVAGVHLEAGVRRSNRHAHAVVVERVPLSDNATKSKDVQHNMSSSKVTEVKEISGVDKSKIVDVKECSPADSKLRRSQRSASKLELSMQSTAAVTIRNSKVETRKEGGAVLEFETHTSQENNSNRRLSKKYACSTGKGEIPMPAAETEKSAQEDDIRSMRNTEAENTSIVDIPADLEVPAASVEGPAKTNIEDEDTSHVDIPLDLDGQAVLVEDPTGRKIEVEDASNVGISVYFDAQAGSAEDPKRVNIEVEDTFSPAYLDTQAALPEDPTRVNIEAEDTSNAGLVAQGALKEDPDLPADLGAQAASVGDPTKASLSAEHTSDVEVEDISNVDFCADVDAEAAAIEARTDSVCDIVAQLSANLPQFKSTIVEVEDISNVDIRADVESAAIEAQTDYVCVNGIDAQLLGNLPQIESTVVEVEDTSNVDIRADVEAAAIEAQTDYVCVNGIDAQLRGNLPQIESTVVEVEDTSNVDVRADVEAAAIEARTDSVCVGGIDAQLSANLPQFKSTIVAVVGTSNVDICADDEVAAIEAQTDSVCDYGRDAQLSANPAQFESTIVEVEDSSNVDIRADVEAAAIKARTDSVCDYGVDAQLSANLPRFESTISTDSNILVEGQGQASCREERYEANDSLTTHFRTPLTAEEDCDNTNLECVGELVEQPQDVSASTNSEAHSHEDINEGHDSHTTLIRTPLKVGKDCSDGNSELVIDESVMQHEGVLESKSSEAHSDEETAEGNDSQTKNIRTPSTAENDGVDGKLELTDELDKHLETAIESPNSEPLSQTPLTAGKNYLAGNSVLVIVDSHVQNEAVLKGRNSESHSHEERAEENDFQTKKIRTPSAAENVCADGDLVHTNDLDHHETAIESISEAHSHKGNDFQTKYTKTPLTEEKDSGDGNLELGVDYLDEQHETVLESIDSEAQSNQERYDGNDIQTTHIGIPSLIAEKDCVNQREEVSPIKLNNCGAHYSSTITNFCNPDMSSFEDTKADEIKSSKMAAENSENLLEHKSPDAIERSASKFLLDRDVSCREDIAHSSGIQGDMLYYAELSAEGVETETKLSGSVFDSVSMESAQTSPSLGLNSKAAREASKAVDLETHLAMSALSPSEHSKGVQPNLNQGMHAAKSNEHEDFGHSLETHEMNSHYESNTDARTSTCGTQDLVEEPIAACDTQSVIFSPGSEGTQIVDGGEGFGVCSEANIKDGIVSVEAVFTTNTPSSGGDAGIVEGTESMDRSFDVEANALDDQPALRMEDNASCQEETSEGKDSKTTPLIAEKVHMECSLYQINDELDKQHAAVGETTSSEAHSASPCEVCEGKERMQPNLEALMYSEPENSEILIYTYDVGSSYNFNDGQAEAMQIQTTLNANESKQEDDTTILPQPAEVLPVQMNSCGLSPSLKIYEHIEMDSLDDLKPVKCDTLEMLDTVGRSTSINELQGDIRYPSDMQREVLAFNEQPAKRVGIASEICGNADDSGTESFRNSYSFDWDGFEAEFNTGVHGFSFGSNISPEDCEEGCRYPLDHAKVPEEEQGTSLFETQVNEHQLNTDEAVSIYQAPDSTEASVSMHYPLFSTSEVADLLSERRSDNQNCTSQQELDQDLLETAAGSILETEAHQCTGNVDEALDNNLVPNLKSDSALGNSLGGAASESISSAAKQAQKCRNARSILIHGTPKRLPATAHTKGNASVSKVDKVGSLTSVRTAKPPPSARKPWK